VFHHAFRSGVFLKTLNSTFARYMGKQSKFLFLLCNMIVNGLEVKKRVIFLLCLHSTMPRGVFFVSCLVIILFLNIKC